MAGVFEALESRQLLATFTVLNTNDAGAGSLRQAILDANALAGADVIQFADAAVGVITLTSQLSITGSLTITGRTGVEISGGDTTRVFDIASTTTASMSDLTIRNGRSTSAAGIQNAGSLTLTRVTLSNNTASSLGTGAGGAILNTSTGTLALTNCLVTGNFATGTSSGNGAGISNSGTLTVTNSTIRNNTAINRGGGILNTGTATIIGSTLSNNLAYNTGGGAIMDLGGELQIINSTLSGNGTDEDGGAIHLSLGSAAEIHNSTITANNAVDLGDGLYIDPTASLLLTSSIVAANGTADIAGTLASGSTNNLVQDDTENGGLTNGVNANLVGVDPLLGALADNGGPTQTHALLAGSPAINAGTNASGQATTDQRGPLFVRTGAPDIGAYEILTLAVVVDSLGDAEDGNVGPGNVTLREAIAATNGNPGADSITFAPALNSGTIQLDDVRLSITDNVSITGPGAANLAITPGSDGGFFIDYDLVVTIAGLTIRDGIVDYNDGAAIENRGTLTISNAIFNNNRANDTKARGGAIYNDVRGSITISNSQFTDNSATDTGGAIQNEGALTVSNSQFTGNSAMNDGGAIYLVERATLTITNTQFTGNSAGDDGGTIYSQIETAVTISGSQFTGSSAADNGGAIVNIGSMTISDSTITGSNAIGEGGAVLNLGSMTISGSTITGSNANMDGGAISNNAASLSITGSTLSNNAAGADGGAIHARNNSTLTMTDCTIHENSSSDDGAGLYLNYVTANISGTTFSSNVAADNGGGIYASSSTIVMHDSTVTGNSAKDDAGLSIFADTAVTITSSTIELNTASRRNGGMAINHSASTVSIDESVVASNSCSSGAGGIENTGTLTITDSTIRQNTATNGSAGGILSEGPLTITRSTIADNVARSAGGISSVGGTLTLVDSTVSDNTATDVNSYAGGIFLNSGDTSSISGSTISGNSGFRAGGIYQQAVGALTVSNSTIADNTSASNAGIGIGISSLRSATLRSTIVSGHALADISGSLASGSVNNLIGDAATAGGLTNGVDGNLVGVDPLLGPLANNGGPTRTHRLLAGSPAINTGANPEALTTDQRGFQRVRGTAIDIGAVEFIGGPSIASFTPPTSSLPLGLSVLLTAGGVADPDGSVAGVRFYLDANANGIGEPGELLFNDTNAADGFKYLYETDSGDSVGSKRFLAVGYDEDGTTGAAQLATVAVTDPVSIGSPVGAANSVNVHRVASVNTIGHVLVYRQGWTYEDLTEKTGAPVATSPAITWVDPKNGLAFVAATSASGLLLFTRSASGTWSFRNLSTETGATSSPSGNLTHFISKRQRIVVIAGITDTGRVVAFRQALTPSSPGVHAYSFIDISADLESQGQTTPALTGLTSYVPKWDTWHLAGVDTMGRIQSIWINTNNPAFTKWRTDNLSNITGAPALSGQLAVTLTAWGGINLTGLDSSGNMLTTWWVPRFGGQWAVSNLTTRYSGPQLVGGNLTAYTTPWGGINYVGLDSAGDVRVYWWVPSFGGTWAISRLLPSSTPDESVPTGRLTSHASGAGTLNVFGTNASGDLLRLAWQPGPGSTWAVENLSEIAVEV